MKSLLLVGGILLLLFGLLLLVAALVTFLMARKRAAQGVAPGQPARPPQPHPAPPRAAAPQGAPMPPPRPAAPPAPPPAAPSAPPAAPPPPPAPPAPATDATVVAGVAPLGTLHAVSGKLAGQTFPLKMDGFYIGRDRTLSEVVVDEPSVSKRHVWVGIREGVPTAVDQSSTNGTYLNTVGTRIGQVRLSPGDTLILADDVARFVYRV